MSRVAPNYAESRAFLKTWSREGPWVLTAIAPTKDGILTRTFTSREESELTAWLEQHGEKWNVYFTVNPLLRPVNSKPAREDVASLAWLHVDVDPRAGEDIESEQARALKLLQEPPGGIPPPSCIVFSGGGYQGFWRLGMPMDINGQEAAYEQAKRYNQQLEIVFGGDNCHNVDRIMRLPGTVNRPDERKRKKGRKEALSHVVRWLEGAYDLTQFTPAPLVQTAGEGFSGRQVRVSGNVRRLASVDELPKEVSGACKVAIVQGMDPDNPNKHPSRSEWLFWVACELVRAGCDDDTIYAVLTDPDFSISSSVLEKGSRAEKYALRQIERAREEAVDPNLRELNDKHAVIGDLGGKCRIISEVYDPVMNRGRISYQSFADFKNRYANRRIDYTDAAGKIVSVPMGNWWVGHPKRRSFETIVFAPGREVPGSYNLWKGFAYEARPGKCDKFLDHILQNLCGTDISLYNYVVGWMATAVQEPDNPGQTAIVLRGKQGTGKGIFAKTFGKLFGRHFMQVADSKHLVGSFNAHLRDCVVLFADEAFFAGDKKHESMLKMIVTEEMITVEAKGVDAEAAANYVHLIMASNEEWVVPAGHDERRFLVLDVSDDKMQNTVFFDAIRAELRAGGYEALLHYLMTFDLSGYDVRRLPRTAALQEQKIFSFTPEQEWWFSKLNSAEVFEGEPWPEYVLSSRLNQDFTTYGRAWSTYSRSSSTRLGRFMKAVCPKGHDLRAQLAGTHQVLLADGSVKMIERPRVFCLPTLDEARLHWDRNFGGPYDWGRLREVQPKRALAEEVPF